MAHPVPIWSHESLKTKYITYLGYIRELPVFKTKKRISNPKQSAHYLPLTLYPAVLIIVIKNYKSCSHVFKKLRTNSYILLLQQSTFFKNHTYTYCIFILFYSTPRRIKSAWIIYITVNLTKSLNIYLSEKEYHTKVTLKKFKCKTKLG